MELNTYRITIICVSKRDIPKIVRNAKVHYRFHKIPLLITILGDTR
jgi:hypothetical protein